MEFWRKILTFLLALTFSADVFAGFWQTISECAEDPCNCGYGTRYEKWNGEKLNKGDENPLCPPYAKDEGRANNICLAKFEMPSVFTAYFQKICAEYTSDTNYFEPKIRVRTQQCNAAACWTTVDTLGWEGECVTLAGPYGLPLTRMCARVALPADPIRDMPADPGYTPKKHLNYEGVSVEDEPFYDYRGKAVYFDAPKLCAYLDPAFIGSGDDGLDIDLLDLDPNKQVFHKTDKVHPVIKVVIFLIEMGKEISKAPAELLGALANMLNDDEEGDTPVAKVLASLFEAISWLIEFFAEEVASALAQVGQINRVVSPEEFGCVNIPMGPYPPPFCNIIAPPFEQANVQRICETQVDGSTIESTIGKPCVVSDLRNNFIHNSVRVSFDNFVPLCRNGENPLETDKCVTIENISGLNMPSAMHLATGKRDIIQHCSKAKDGEVCINSQIPYSCSVGSNGCNKGWRVVYGLRIGAKLSPKEYYRDDLKDCNSNSIGTCQEIWGVNTGEFVDIALQFPKVQDPNVTTPLNKNFVLKDKTGSINNFVASIVRESTLNNKFQLHQSTKEICVFGVDNVIGCIKRENFTAANIYDCSSKQGGVNCVSSYFEPKAIISAEIGSDSTSSVAAISTVYDFGAYTNYSVVNLAGYKFTAFVTDESNAKKPFSGANAVNPSSIFGKYFDDKKPVTNSGAEDPSAVYIKGIEYINGKYLRGGKRFCLEPSDLKKCPEDKTKCVLTKLENKDLVKCSTFFSKAARYAGLRVCKSSDKLCTITDNIPLKAGGIMPIYRCSQGQYCYNSSNNEELCQVSYEVNKRHDPSASFGEILPDSKYYNLDGSPGYNYDKDKYILRDKTAYEMNLCSSIPQPICDAKSEGNAYWSQANVGEKSIGTCLEGYVPDNVFEMTRYCLVNSDLRIIFLESIGNKRCKKRE